MASIFLQHVPLVGQPTGTSCWLTAAEMIYQFFHSGHSPLRETATYGANRAVAQHLTTATGQAQQQFLTTKFMNSEGLMPAEVDNLAAYGLAKVAGPPSGVWTVWHMINLLAGYGPLWAGGNWVLGFKHAVTIVGASADNNRIYYHNPLPEGQGAVGQWTEATAAAKLATAVGGTIMAYTNGKLEADEFGSPGPVITRFAVTGNAPQVTEQ